MHLWFCLSLQSSLLMVLTQQHPIIIIITIVAPFDSGLCRQDYLQIYWRAVTIVSAPWGRRSSTRGVPGSHSQQVKTIKNLLNNEGSDYDSFITSFLIHPFLLVTHRSLLLLTSVLKMICLECPEICQYLLLSNRICTLIDLISQHLNVGSLDHFGCRKSCDDVSAMSWFLKNDR